MAPKKRPFSGKGLNTKGGATPDQARRRIELGRQRGEFARLKPGPQIPPDQRGGIHKLQVDLKRRQVKDAVKKAFGPTFSMGGIVQSKTTPSAKPLSRAERELRIEQGRAKEELLGPREEKLWAKQQAREVEELPNWRKQEKLKEDGRHAKTPGAHSSSQDEQVRKRSSGRVGVGLSKASDKSSVKKLLKGAGRLASRLGPVGAAAGALAGSDPLEAAAGRAGENDDNFARKKLGPAGYAKMRREERAYYERKRERALDRIRGVKARPKARPKAPKIKGRK